MANYIDYVVLDVGQGSGNFIEYRDDSDDSLIGTYLIDLGSERAAKTTAGGPSAEYVVATLKEMAQPTISALIFSHSDSDHINLMIEVLDSFWPYGTKGKAANDTLFIEYVWYGGDYSRYEKRNKNILDTVLLYMNKKPKNMQSVSYQATSFSKGKASTPLVTMGGEVTLYLLVGNAANSATDSGNRKKRKLDGYAINSNSLVISATFGGAQLVATGDATGATLVECNNVLNKKDITATFFNNVFMVTLPHHGSATTTFDIRGYVGSAETNLTEFSENLNANTITASAERVRTFKHPSCLVMEYFWDELSSTVFWEDKDFLKGQRHFYTAHFTREEGYTRTEKKKTTDFPIYFAWWYTVQTVQNIFTNLYYDWGMQGEVILPPKAGKAIDRLDATAPQPPLGVAWCYRVKADGTKRMIPIINRPSLMQLRMAMLAGVPPEDLPVPTRAQLQAEDADLLAASARSVQQRRTSPVIVHPRQFDSPAPVPPTALLRLKVLP